MLAIAAFARPFPEPPRRCAQLPRLMRPLSCQRSEFDSRAANARAAYRREAGGSAGSVADQNAAASSPSSRCTPAAVGVGAPLRRPSASLVIATPFAGAPSLFALPRYPSSQSTCLRRRGPGREPHTCQMFRNVSPRRRLPHRVWGGRVPRVRRRA
eukprot:6182055-Pleurochrysis_carterae.AAC.3